MSEGGGGMWGCNAETRRMSKQRRTRCCSSSYTSLGSQGEQRSAKASDGNITAFTTNKQQKWVRALIMQTATLNVLDLKVGACGWWSYNERT